MTHNARFLKDIRAVLLDFDGTLWRGRAPTPGAADFLDLLQQHDIAYRVATNSAVKPASVYSQALQSAGLPVDEDHMITVSVATAAYLRTRLPEGARVYVVGQEGLHQALTEAGFVILPDASQPVDAVVVGGDLTLTYEKLKHATLLIHQGALFIGTNPDVVYPIAEGLAPECGANLAFLTATTGVQPEVVGKPQPHLFQMSLQRLGVPPAQAVMIGDRLETDIHGAQQAGLRAILVSTGVDNADSVVRKGIAPDLVVTDLGELTRLWQAVK
ncbi:MAG: HAD-IIA family hydrolase [Anaerolineae bacterium]|nr:HAD-IIA family hydrolase [Anaerolineae bacterium]